MCTSTDPFVGRMGDAHATIHRVKGHAVLGTFDLAKYTKARAYCRVGRYANSIQIAIAKMKEHKIPLDLLTKVATWKQYLPLDSALSEHTCANLANTAFEESRKDLRN